MSIPWPVEEQFTNSQSRLNYLWKTRALADCGFVVGKDSEVVMGHKAVLTFASRVFHEKLQETGNDFVVIDNIELEIFECMLKYIYTDVADITSALVAIKLGEAAKAYEIWQLEKLCYNYLVTDLTPQNVLQRYQLAIKECDYKLLEKCTEIIKQKTAEVLNDNSFVEASIDIVLEIFSLDHLEIDSEIELLHAADRYFKYNEKDNNSDKAVNIRSLLKKIRFCTLTPQQFVEGTVGTSVLPAGDCWAILANMASKNSSVPMPEGFSTIKLQRKMKKANEFKETFTLKLNDVIKGEGASTPEFCVGSHKWGVRMFSYTAIRDDDDDYLDCIVTCLDNKVWMCNTQVTVSLQRPDHFGPCLKRTRSCIFTSGRPKLWINRFIKLERVLDAPCNGYLQDGALILEVTIKILEKR